MSSDNYERVVKLWISLWNLILEDNRHLASVAATLQKLVFEKQGWPGYKNWPAICKLGKRDRLMMLAVATLNMHRTDEQVHNIIAAFPECFSDIETQGPIPLSVIRAKAVEIKTASGEDRVESAADFPESWGVIKHFHLPKLEFK